MINKLLFIPFLILTSESLISQAAIFWDEEISENEIILFGPSNVSKYFVGQSEIYNEKYKALEIKLEVQLEKKQDELEEYKSRKIRNAAKLGNMNHEIQGYNLKLELIHEFINKWENHKEKFLYFQESFLEVFEEESCYCFEAKEDVYCADEVSIDKLYPNENITYKETIRDQFKQVSKVINDDVIPKKNPLSSSISSIRLDDETTHYEIIERSIQELLRYESKPRNGEDEIKESITTDEGLELVERYFKTMKYDEQENELIISVDYILNRSTIQVIDTFDEVQLVAENFRKTSCD